jgi:hypothetical protein
MGDGGETKQVTRAELEAGLTLQTGRRHRIVVTEALVELHVDWPAHVVERLPDDFTLTLSGPALPKQELTRDAAAALDDDMMRFDFSWRDKSKVVTLEAAGNGQTIALWRGHVSGDLTVAVDWDKRLDPLLLPPEELELAGEATNAGEVPDDLRSHELSSLLEGLFS